VLSGSLGAAGVGVAMDSFVSTAPAVRELRSANMASNSSPFFTLEGVSRGGIRGALGAILEAAPSVKTLSPANISSRLDILVFRYSIDRRCNAS